LNTRADGTLIIDNAASQSQEDPNSWSEMGDFRSDNFNTVLQNALSPSMFEIAQAEITQISSVMSEEPISVTR
jgi:hypothetical protein